MIKAKFFIFITLLISNLIGFGQKSQIAGYVTDRYTGQSIPFASVSVYGSSYTSAIGSAVTDDFGKFKVELPGTGEFRLIVSFIGYKSDTIQPVLVKNSKIGFNTGNIGLLPANVEIGIVEVKAMANTSSRKIDRQTYRANDFGTAKGGTAVDVLNKLPSISVDPDGTVSVRGTSEFMVYLNGKPTQLDASVLLGQISANSIEQIDVITVPTARYEAQGKGGIINIETKKTGTRGFSVSANGLTGGSPWANFNDGFSNYKMNDNRVGSGINMIYNNNKVSTYGGFNLNNRNINGSRTGDARLLQSDGSYYHMVAGGERPEWFKNYSASFGFDYFFLPTSSLSASFFYGNRRDGRSAFYVYNNFYGDINKNPIPGINSENHWVYNPNTDEKTGRFQTGSFDISHKLDKSTLVQFSFLYELSGLSRELQNQDFEYNKATNKTGLLQSEFRESDDLPLNGLRLSIDFDKEFENGNTLGIGIQPQVINQSGDFNFKTFDIADGIWKYNTNFENHLDIGRTLLAFYADYSAKWDKLSAIAGLRFEYMSQLLELTNPDYLNIFNRPTKPDFQSNKADFFPTLHLKYALNERDALIFAASRRINRPQTKNLAPFLYRRHYEVYEVGDPELKAEYLTNFELSLDKKLGKQGVNLTGFYRGTDNAVFRVNTVYDLEKVLIRSFTNSGNIKSMGAEVNSNLVAGKNLKFFFGGSLYDFKVKGDVFGFSENNRSLNWSLKGNMNLQIIKSLKLTLDYDYKSATVTTQGKNMKMFLANGALNFTPEKLKGWDFGLKVLDVLSTNLESLYTRAYNSAGKQIFYQDVEYDRYGPVVELSASWSLNMKGKSTKKADSAFGKEQF